MKRSAQTKFILTSSDYTSPVFFWINIELALGVVCACLPTLRPIWLNMKQTSFSSKSSIPLSSYSGHGSRQSSKKHQRISDTSDEQGDVYLTKTSRVDTHIQAGKRDMSEQPEGHVITIQQHMSTESTSRGHPF